MHHAITLGGLLAVVGGLLGIVLIVGGGLTVFAGSMSDSPDAGNQVAANGCFAALIGLALLGGSLWLAFA